MHRIAKHGRALAYARAFACAAALGAAACGVRAPSAIDTTALVAKHGAVEARRRLEVRVVEDPRDVAARLALANLSEQQGRPSAAIEQLEVVAALGGPIGRRWHDDDRARLARLLAARGRERLARGAASALRDLSRGRDLGAKVDAQELARARVAAALVKLRHVDAEERASGLDMLRDVVSLVPAAAGVRDDASPEQRAELGAWLWDHGAKRAAWEALSAWHAATKPPRDARLERAYLAAHAWWTPSDASPPLAAPADEPDEAAAWLASTLRDALRGDASWGPSFAARVAIDTIAVDGLPAAARAAFGRLAGRSPVADATAAANASSELRLVAAAGLALRRAPAADVRGALGEHADTEEGRALLRIVEAPDSAAPADPHAAALVAYVTATAPPTRTDPATGIDDVIAGYGRDPTVADRLGRDFVAEATDAAAAHAALGALFDALGDPARARSAWQAAADATAEPAFVRGLAEALARANDPDAAMIMATKAAAAWGDPAVVWVGVANALDANGHHVHALEASRFAIDLAGPATIADALDVAIRASRTLGRTPQADALAARRATVAPPITTARDDDPTDAVAALAAHRAAPSDDTTSRLWIASRWNPRDVASRAALRAALAADDPRRRAVTAELVALAADRDAERARAAVRALQPR